MKPLFSFAFLFATVVFQLCALPARAIETTYWVWNRKTPLRNEEVRLLGDQSARKLYWHAATVHAAGEVWRLETPIDLPGKNRRGISFAPIIRLETDGAMPLGSAAADSVSRVLLDAARRMESGEVQIDFDCPDKRLGEYAEFLAKCRAAIAPLRLSATALAGWSKSPEFGNLQAAVDMLMPMFYDLAPDDPARVHAGHVLPLIDPLSLASQIESWRSCRIPWFAGIPNFARITIFDQKGRSRGHLRAWEWDSICFNPALVLSARLTSGVTLLRVESDTILGSTPVSANETVACRWPDLSQFANAMALVEKSGASGVAIFRLPGAGSQSGWSLSQMTTVLLTRKAGEPQFKVRRTSQGLELTNVSNSDLPPRLSGNEGERDRGWQLEVESSGGAIFREASAGEFANVFGHADPDAASPTRVQIPLARRLTYWFSDMRAGQSRQTGLLQLAPGGDPVSLRWRIPGSRQHSQWQSLE